MTEEAPCAGSLSSPPAASRVASCSPSRPQLGRPHCSPQVFTTAHFTTTASISLAAAGSMAEVPAPGVAAVAPLLSGAEGAHGAADVSGAAAAALLPSEAGTPGAADASGAVG